MGTMSFKVTEDEARRERLSLSAYLRSRAAGTPAGNAVGKVHCQLTGAEIFSSPAGAAPLTTETIREILSDFP